MLNVWPKLQANYYPGTEEAHTNPRASEGSASEPSLARRVSMCKDAKLSCRGNTTIRRKARFSVRVVKLAPGCRRHQESWFPGRVQRHLMATLAT